MTSHPYAIAHGAGRCSRIPDNSLTAISWATAGHPAMTRLTTPSSAVAMLAARLAPVLMASAARGSHPDRRPARRSASSTRDATISTASTDNGSGGTADPFLGPLSGGRRAGHLAVFGAGDLGKRTGSGSPSMRMGWFAR